MSERIKVLVVDDDVVSRMVLMHLVDTSGAYELHEAEDGEHAWSLLEQGLRPAVTFSDLRMPRLSGLELLARVKAAPELAGMPFVLASAANERDTVSQASGLGATAYLVKPFRPEEVRDLLASLQQRGGQGDEAPAQTVQRLGIDASRLLLYLSGLHGQLLAAGPEIEHLLSSGDAAGAGERLARLAEGCRTLGLASAAAMLDALQARPDAPGSAESGQALEMARQHVLRQSSLARALAAS